MWWKQAQIQDGTMQVPNNVLRNILFQFINHGGTANPQFIRDMAGKTYLLIHGSQPDTEGKVHFYIGNETYENNPQGYIPDSDLGEWLVSKGYPANTQVVACYAGLAKGINSAFHNTGELQIAVPETGEGEQVQITPAYSDKEVKIAEQKHKLKNMIGKVCEKCYKGEYQEMRVEDDWDGMVTCNKCGYRIKRWRKK